MSDIKYLKDGTAVYVIETTSKGLLVETLYDCGNGGEFSSDSDHPFIVSEVFTAAPTMVKDKRITELDAKIKEMEAQRSELAKLDRESKEALLTAQKRLSVVDKLAPLFDYLEGKITHYVSYNYGSLIITPFEKAGYADSDYRDREGKIDHLKLLTLFGGSNGELNWKLNVYKDGSGHNTIVYPATSYGQAIEIITGLFADKMAKGPSVSAIEGMDTYGIPVPLEYRKAVQEELVTNLRAKMTKLVKDADKAEQELREAESKL